MIQIRISCRIKSKRPETNVIQRLIIKRKHFVRGLDQLLHGQSGVIRFDDYLRNFRRRKHADGAENPIGVFLLKMIEY